MSITITRRFEFDAAHRVMGHEGKCRHLHGHRYVAEVTCTSPSLNSLGMVIDFSVVKDMIGGWIDKYWDHNTILNGYDLETIKFVRESNKDKDPYLLSTELFSEGQTPFNPTAENMAKVLFHISKNLLGTRELTREIKVVKVRLYETPNCWADYEPNEVKNVVVDGKLPMLIPLETVTVDALFTETVKKTIRSNQQKPEKQLITDMETVNKVDIVDIFHTIQGEGPYAGTPAIFIRMAGCNLQCPNCDTDYTSVRRLMSPDEAVDKVKEFKHKHPYTNLVVITGGEPLRQNIEPLVRRLIGGDAPFKVQLETNGSITRKWVLDRLLSDGGKFSVVISPKTVIQRTYLFGITTPYLYWKFLVNNESKNLDGISLCVLGNQTPLSFRDGSGYGYFFDSHATRELGKMLDRVYVQPEEDVDPQKTKKNTELAVIASLTYGYKLSLQTHKFLGLK